MDILSIVREFTYLGHRVNAGGECEAGKTDKVKMMVGQVQRMWMDVAWKEVFSKANRGVCNTDGCCMERGFL